VLGNDPDLLEIADHLEALGKKVWRHLGDDRSGSKTATARSVQRTSGGMKRIISSYFFSWRNIGITSIANNSIPFVKPSPMLTYRHTIPKPTSKKRR